jgi:uncharacterized protein (TIGR03067 family)
MPDEFQPLPPRPSDDAGPPLSPYDRFAEVNLRKPGSEGYDWRWIKLTALFSGLGLLLLLMAFTMIGHSSRGTFVYVGKPIGPAPAPAPAPVANDDGERLEGIWVATAVTIDGTKATDEDVAQVRLTIEPRGFRLVLPQETHKGFMADRNVLDRRNLDFIVPGEADRLAIYALDGDILTVCFTQDDKRDATRRPTDFTAEKGSGRTLLVLKRSLRDDGPP